MGNVERFELAGGICTVCPPTYGPPDHAQVHLSGEWSACVDAGIAPLIAELWLAGIPTSYSCERNQDDMAQLLFPRCDAYERLLTLTHTSTATSTRDLHARMLEQGFDRWILSVAQPDIDFEPADAGADDRLRLNVLIPLEDVRQLTMYLAELRGGIPHPFPDEPAPASASWMRTRLGESRWAAIVAFEEAAREAGSRAVRAADNPPSVDTTPH